MITYNLLMWRELPNKKMYISLDFHNLYPAIYRVLREEDLTLEEHAKKRDYIADLMLREPDTVLYAETGENVPDWLLIPANKTASIVTELRKHQIKVE